MFAQPGSAVPIAHRAAALRALGAPLHLAVAAAVAMAPIHTARAASVELKDGRVLVGKLVQLTSLAEPLGSPRSDGAPDPKKIVMIDDGLHRYFVSMGQVLRVNERDAGETIERVTIDDQPVARAGSRVTSLGPLSEVKPFDEFGHRSMKMLTSKGPRFVMQGITLVTPTWCKVESLSLRDGPSFVWDQRVATNSIPHETLDKFLRKHIDPKHVEQRLIVARLYIQMERFNEAGKELAAIIADFPEHRDQLEPTQRTLVQRTANRLLDEVEVRAKAGQHNLAVNILSNFPAEGVAGATLQRVREMLDRYKADFDTGKDLLKQLDAVVAKVQDAQLQQRIKPVRDEIFGELNYNTLARMAAFRQSIADEQMPPEEKASLALSGWLIGGNAAIRKLPVALSLFTVRNLAREYLAEPSKLKRDQILERLRSEEGYTPEYVAKIVAHMTPPKPTTEAPTPTPGFYELALEASDGRLPVTYYVQLPPEYDPKRMYPAVITLHGAGSTPQQQVDWWAGPPGKDGVRLGQATRHGYIVIAPAWGKEQQQEYHCSAEEHATVLNTLRDACRRFSIDTDRVFISGHSMGGDAAWDIGLAHPDLWAGLIPIVAKADKYIVRYWEHVKRVPFYLVAGELDGSKTAANARHLDRYFISNFDATVAEFQGRGHENFSDEILQLLDWMNRKKRDFAVKDFVALSMRPWDNFFWWLELGELPPKTMVDPADWPPPGGTRPAETTARINATNGINVSTGADRVTLWLSPALIDFKRKITFSIKGDGLRMAQPFIEPDARIILEDVRTRGDRQHPFWAKVEAPSGRVNVAER